MMYDVYVVVFVPACLCMFANPNLGFELIETSPVDGKCLKEVPEQVDMEDLPCI